jgi:very-short-patch-repair endonuclease
MKASTPCAQLQRRNPDNGHDAFVLRPVVFTRAQAFAAGWTPRRIRTELTSGRWVQLAPGRYVEASSLVGASPEKLHAIHAMARGFGRQLVIHRESAACLHGLRVLSPPARVATAKPASFPSADIVSARAMNLTTPARTVIDVARFRGIEAGLVVADSAIAQRLLDRATLTARLAEMGRCQSRKLAEVVAAEASGLAESAFESVSRYRLLRGGIPRPELQARLMNYRVDFLWRAQAVIGEADGLTKYGTDERTVRARIRAERERQRALEDAGYIIVRWLWDEIWNTPQIVVERLRRKLAA